MNKTHGRITIDSADFSVKLTNSSQCEEAITIWFQVASTDGEYQETCALRYDRYDCSALLDEHGALDENRPELREALQTLVSQAMCLTSRLPPSAPRDSAHNGAFSFMGGANAYPHVQRIEQ